MDFVIYIFEATTFWVLFCRIGEACHPGPGHRGAKHLILTEGRHWHLGQTFRHVFDDAEFRDSCMRVHVKVIQLYCKAKVAKQSLANFLRQDVANQPGPARLPAHCHCARTRNPGHKTFSWRHSQETSLWK